MYRDCLTAKFGNLLLNAFQVREKSLILIVKLLTMKINMSITGAILLSVQGHYIICFAFCKFDFVCMEILEGTSYNICRLLLTLDVL
jgi:hypothetical protein